MRKFQSRINRKHTVPFPEMLQILAKSLQTRAHSIFVGKECTAMLAAFADMEKVSV